MKYLVGHKCSPIRTASQVSILMPAHFVMQKKIKWHSQEWRNYSQDGCFSALFKCNLINSCLD
jgi:hypothetical protein